MVKVFDRVRKISLRIPFMERNGREFDISTMRADVTATDDFFLNTKVPIPTQKRRNVRGLWRGHVNTMDQGKENDSSFANKSYQKRPNQNKKSRKSRKTETPRTIRTRQESIAWCKLLYERECSTSTATSDTSFELERKYQLSKSKKLKMTKSLSRRLAFLDEGTSTTETPSSTRTAPVSKVKFRDPVYTTLYPPDGSWDSPTSTKTDPVTDRTTKRQPVYTEMYVPDGNKRKSCFSRKKFVDGQLRLRVSAQDAQVLVTAFEMRGLLELRDAESFVHVKVSILPDFPQRERFRTKSVPITSEPAIFNETFTLNVPEVDRSRRLLISVWQTIKGSEVSTFTGCMSFSANKLLQRHGIVEGWYQLLGETLGKRKHSAVRTLLTNGSEENDCEVFSRYPDVQPEKAIGGYNENYPAIGRSQKVRFQLHSQLRRDSSCETVKSTRTDYGVKRTKLGNATSSKRYDSDTGRLGTTRRHRQDRKSYIGRSPVRAKWRKRNSLADSPKFVTNARIVTSHRQKSAKVISRHHQQLRLRGNSPDVKVLYTDETECATHLSSSTSAESVCKDLGINESEGINQCMNKDKLTSSKDQDTDDLTLSNHPQVTIPTMTSGMRVPKNDANGRLSYDDYLTNGPSFDHLTVTKSGRVKERKQMRSPTLFRATHIGQANSETEGQSIPLPPVPRPREETQQKEHLYASIDEIRQEIASSKSGSAVTSQQPVFKSPVRRSKSSGDQLPTSPSKRDFNMNFTATRKRNSNTDSGLFVQLEAAGAETKVAELFSLNGENQKSAKLKNSNGTKTNQKENKEPPSTTKDADVPRVLTKGGIFSASAKRANKKSFRQSKKLSTCDPSKANELTLKDLLKNKSALNAFREFLTSEHSTENLDFWLECESYKSVKESKMLKTAHNIFAQYLARSAPREVNMELSIRNRTEERLKHIDRETFSEAQECIFNLMKTDSFRRFLTTSKYKAMTETHEGFKLLPRVGSARRK